MNEEHSTKRTRLKNQSFCIEGTVDSGHFASTLPCWQTTRTWQHCMHRRWTAEQSLSHQVSGASWKDPLHSKNRDDTKISTSAHQTQACVGELQKLGSDSRLSSGMHVFGASGPQAQTPNATFLNMACSVCSSSANMQRSSEARAPFANSTTCSWPTSDAKVHIIPRTSNQAPPPSTAQAGRQ